MTTTITAADRAAAKQLWIARDRIRAASLPETAIAEVLARHYAAQRAASDKMAELLREVADGEGLPELPPMLAGAIEVALAEHEAAK